MFSNVVNYSNLYKGHTMSKTIKATKVTAPVAAKKTAPAKKTTPNLGWQNTDLFTVAAKKTAPAAPAKKTTPNLAKVTNQVKFLETYLRGTGRMLSAAQAEANYGIKNLAARMSEFRKCGLQVRTDVNTAGKTVYAVSARDTNGSRSKVFA